MGRPHLSSAYLSQPPSLSQQTTVPLYVDAPFDLDNVKPEDVVYEAFLASEHTLQNTPSTPALHPDVTGPSTSQNMVPDASRDALTTSNGSPAEAEGAVRSGDAQARTSTPSPGLAATTDLLSSRGLDPTSLPYLSQLVDRLQEAMTRARPEMERAARTEDPLEHRLPRVEAIFRPYLDDALLPFRAVPEIDYVGRLFERRIVLNAFGHDSGFVGVGETATSSNITTSTPEPTETTIDVAVEAPVKLEEGSSEDDTGMSTEYDTDLNSDTDFSDCASDPGFDEEDIYMQDADIRSLSPSLASVASEERCGTPFLPAPPNKHEVDLTRWWTPSRPTSVTGWSRASSLSRCQSPLPRSSVRSPMSDSTCSEEDDLQSPTSSYCIGSGQLHPFFRPASPHVSAASITAKRAGNSFQAHPAIASPLAFKLPSAYPDIKIVDYANV